MKRFKDKCDRCGKFDILKTFNGLCLCSKCFSNKISDLKNVKQLTIFDKEVRI